MEKLAILGAGIARCKGAIREGLYLRTGLDLTVPDAIRGIVNQRCNYHCLYCYSWQRDRFPEISIAEWQEALRSLKAFAGRYTIQFGGGEPFLKKGFTQLLDFCHQNGIAWGVITNGSLLDQQTVEAIVDAGPQNVDLSIDSSDPATNDLVRGAVDSVRVIGEGLERLSRERARRGRRFLIRIKPTVTLQSFRHLTALLPWALERGADDVDYSPVRPEPFWTEQTFATLWIGEPQLPELRRVVEALVELKLGGAPIETTVEKLRSFPDHFLRRQVHHGVSPCRVGMRDYFIRPDGEVETCWEYPTIGSVTGQSARALWRGPKARALRAQTVACRKFGTLVCANSCITHRTLWQEGLRALQFLRMGRASRAADARRVAEPG